MSSVNSEEETIMSGNILSDVNRVAGNISPLSVILLLIITLVGVIVMITLCNGGLAAVKALWNRLFGRKK